MRWVGGEETFIYLCMEDNEVVLKCITYFFKHILRMQNYTKLA